MITKDKVYKAFFIFAMILLFSLFLGRNVSATNIDSNKYNAIFKLLEEYPNVNRWVSCRYRNREIIYLIECSDDVKIYANSNGDIRTCSGQKVQWYNFWYYPDTQKTVLFWSGLNPGHGENDFTNVVSNFTLYSDATGEEITYNPFKSPYIANSAEELSTGKSDFLRFFCGSLNKNDSIGLRISKVSKSEYDFNNDGVLEEYEYYDCLYKKQLDGNSQYYHCYSDISNFDIPFSVFPFTFKNKETYVIELVNDVDGNEIITPDYQLYDSVRFTVGGLTAEDEEANRHKDLINSNKQQTDAIKDQTEAIKENNETNKNIFEKIGELLSYINPLSENFFVYKLIELLINALKFLFVPSDTFFNTWLDDLNQYFSDTFGILYYPFDLLIDFLNRISGIANSNSAVISVPAFVLSFMGHSVTIFNSMSFDLNSILVNDTFKNIHDVYLVFTDVILWLGLVYLAANCLNNVIGGMGHAAQDIRDNSDEVQDEKAYQNYARGQRAQERYTREQYEAQKKNHRKAGF